MIRSEDQPISPEDSSGKRAGKCWHRGPNAQAIRLETESNGIFLFPYHHLVFAHLADSGGGNEIMTLGFPSHTAEIRGKRLHPILNALDDFTVAWVCVLPSQYAAIAPKGAAVVTGIEVRSGEQDAGI